MYAGTTFTHTCIIMYYIAGTLCGRLQKADAGATTSWSDRTGSPLDNVKDNLDLKNILYLYLFFNNNIKQRGCSLIIQNIVNKKISNFLVLK